MTTENSRAVDEVQIRGLINERIAAVRTKDVNKAMASLASEILSFDVVNPSQYKSSEGSRGRMNEWFSSFQGPIGYEVRELNITAGDEAAFSHCLSHVSAVKADGVELDMWWRTTVCYRKIDGKWLVTHEHNSVPFDPKNGMASIGLKP